MAKKAAVADPGEEPKDVLQAALDADPWDRTEEQRALIVRADADVRLQSMLDDQRKLKNAPSDY